MPTERLVMRRVREHPECRKEVQPDEACLSRDCNPATPTTTISTPGRPCFHLAFLFGRLPPASSP